MPRRTGVRWEAGRCAVLEELSDDGVVRRLVFRPAEVGWEVAGEELLVDGEVRLAVAYEDYRPVGEAGLWPHRSRIEDRLRGSRVVLETRKVRTEGVTDAFFAMQDP